jgi:excisionase family DNA binding protein
LINCYTNFYQEQRMPEQPTPEWLTIDQAAAWLQVSTKTIRRYIEAGSLPAVNLGGRAIRIRRQDLETWLETRRIEPGVSLRQQDREGRRENRRQRHARPPHPPRTLDPVELQAVNLTLDQGDPPILRCNNCGTTWTPELRPNGRLRPLAWRCPNGCNR